MNQAVAGKAHMQHRPRQEREDKPVQQKRKAVEQHTLGVAAVGHTIDDS